jgi:hypothetical protein
MFFPAAVCNVLRSAIWLVAIGSVLPPSQVFGCDCCNCSVEFIDGSGATCCVGHKMAVRATCCQLATDCRNGGVAQLNQAPSGCWTTCNCSQCECNRGKPARQTTPAASSRFPGRDTQTIKATGNPPNLLSPANPPPAACLSETTGHPLPSSVPLRVLYCVWLN